MSIVDVSSLLLLNGVMELESRLLLRFWKGSGRRPRKNTLTTSSHRENGSIEISQAHVWHLAGAYSTLFVQKEKDFSFR